MSRHADVWIGDANLARAKALTGDQAGGGLATTARDLATLLRGLERGEPVPLDRLGADWTKNAMSAGLDYGYGTWRWRPGGVFFALASLPSLRGVSGATNSFAYLSDDGTVITGTFDQSEPPSRHVQFVLSKVLPTLSRVEDRAATGDAEASDATAPNPKAPKSEGRIVSAYYGLDKLPPIVSRICGPKSVRKDGMPVTFSVRLNGDTIEPEDFAVTTASGRNGDTHMRDPGASGTSRLRCAPCCLPGSSAPRMPNQARWRLWARSRM